ncbi:NADH:flavin oxidoreductase [Aurantimonas sp. 22II-16-19i]|uniref:NADH:flavin oxidoreductase n=1 Tax=Aurantimonas sp. 22II-16-19i TaxID=1317114 RepID=UPI0009F7E019|nr:NADH:flavin oxidoreductase [Aurantimonas sp. 22II-16-19i]ORE95092.1 NADH:flavin oxidoreductase [Aurantimonas sp. 22II-16-19i]
MLDSLEPNATSPGISPPKDPLLQPLTIRHLTLRNRIMSTSHACGLEVGGMPQEAYQRYHLEKAKGGLALSMFGGSSNVDRDSPNIFRQLNVGSDAIIPHLQQFSERMHGEGAALMCQISHLGRRGDPYAGDWLTTIAPSPLRETLHRSIPKEMDEHDIDRVVKAYGAAARRCKEGGLDGIETLSAGHLIGQFLSPVTNRRTDRFGGSLENRCRFALMVHEAIRQATGGDFLVGIRFVVDEATPGGMDFDECVRAAQILTQNGAVDFFNAIYGTMDTTRALAEENMPGMGSPLAPWVEPVGAFRREVGLPVFHAARISDLASARFAVAEGKVDMAGMTRAQIADPHMVEKLAAGREDQVRPCIGATHCQSPYRPSCLHNPVTGRETTLSHVTAPTKGRKRKVVIVGGGPAGLEAARISAERGHDVTLYEAAADVGGQILLGATGSWRRDLIGIVEWRVAELERRGVPIHTNSYMEAGDITALGPDVVILATGGLPQVDLSEGSELCVSTWDIVSGQTPVGRDVLVYDGTGRHPAPLAAERAKEAGANVTYATIDANLAEELTYAERLRWKKRFLSLGLQPISDTRLLAVRRRDNRLEAVLLNEISRQETAVPVDQVIVEQGSIPMNELFEALRTASSNEGVTDIETFVRAAPQPMAARDGFELHRIGDALSSRNIHAAMLDAVRICSPL